MSNSIMTDLGTEVGAVLKDQETKISAIEAGLQTPVPANAVFTDTVYDDTAIQADVATKVTYFSQSLEPADAVNGDLWQDTDTGVIARVIEENGIKTWVEV